MKKPGIRGKRWMPRTSLKSRRKAFRKYFFGRLFYVRERCQAGKASKMEKIAISDVEWEKYQAKEASEMEKIVISDAKKEGDREGKASEMEKIAISDA
ncbi:MAG: hypothetical protein K6G45_06995 [Lachnospiraceae bacterium]|nr:hypothetical protein [Lachnospiraceae bacterium]